MTPAARVATAIAVLDDILAGEPAERALTRWARASRYAGSRDRAAVRDMVFDCLRQRRSLVWRSGQGLESGRALMIGHQAAAMEPLAEVFDGSPYGPPALTGDELAALAQDRGPAPLPVALDYPDFLGPELHRSLGAGLADAMATLQARAPVDLRVNALKATRAQARAALAAEGIATQEVALADTALRVTANPRLVAGSAAYRSGMVELQDAASQAVALAAGAEPGMCVLDYCAGGGGKTLAMGAAMAGQGRLFAHDVNPARMKDIPERAARAGVAVTCLRTADLARMARSCDLVFVDAPCSGSGAWRRNPDAKWRLTQERLSELTALQSTILHDAAALVRPGGRLVYATCSILACENDDTVRRFLDAHPGARLLQARSLAVSEAGDGFYFAAIEIS